MIGRECLHVHRNTNILNTCTLRHDVYYLTVRSLDELKTLIQLGQLSPSGHKPDRVVDRVFTIIFGQSSKIWLMANVPKSTSSDESQAPLENDKEDILLQEHMSLKLLTLRNGLPDTEVSLYPFFSNFYGGLCGFESDVNFSSHCINCKERPTLHSRLHCLEVVCVLVKVHVHLGVHVQYGPKKSSHYSVVVRSYGSMVLTIE